MEGRGGLWEEHVGGVELVSKLLGWSGTRSGKRDHCGRRWTDEEEKREENDKGANVWKKELKGKSKRKGQVERRNMWRWKMKGKKEKRK